MQDKSSVEAGEISSKHGSFAHALASCQTQSVAGAMDFEGDGDIAGEKSHVAGVDNENERDDKRTRLNPSMEYVKLTDMFKQQQSQIDNMLATLQRGSSSSTATQPDPMQMVMITMMQSQMKFMEQIAAQQAQAQANIALQLAASSAVPHRTGSSTPLSIDVDANHGERPLEDSTVSPLKAKTMDPQVIADLKKLANQQEKDLIKYIRAQRKVSRLEEETKNLKERAILPDGCREYKPPWEVPNFDKAYNLVKDRSEPYVYPSLTIPENSSRRDVVKQIWIFANSAIREVLLDAEVSLVAELEQVASEEAFIAEAVKITPPESNLKPFGFNDPRDDKYDYAKSTLENKAKAMYVGKLAKLSKKIAEDEKEKAEKRKKKEKEDADLEAVPQEVHVENYISGIVDDRLEARAAAPEGAVPLTPELPPDEQEKRKKEKEEKRKAELRRTVHFLEVIKDEDKKGDEPGAKAKGKGKSKDEGRKGKGKGKGKGKNGKNNAKDQWSDQKSKNYASPRDAWGQNTKTKKGGVRQKDLWHGSESGKWW